MNKNSTIIVILFLMLISFQSSVYAINISNPKNNNKYSTFYSEEEDPLGLKPGDILFTNADVIPDWCPDPDLHCLMFVEYNNYSWGGQIYTFIQASPMGGVCYRNYTKSDILESDSKKIRRVKDKYINATQQKNAIDFAKLRLGDGFSIQTHTMNKNYNPEDLENDSYANVWYCSELIWAAYYNCNNSFPKIKPENGYIYGEGIDLDPNGWEIDLISIKEDHFLSAIHPIELLNTKKNKYLKEVKLDGSNSKIIQKNYFTRMTNLVKVILNLNKILKPVFTKFYLDDNIYNNI